MKVLLHICCAPCSTEVFNRLSLEHEVTGFFYNPNIHPPEEYISRLNELERFTGRMNLPLIKADYEVKKWYEAVTGLEEEPEGGLRCESCFRLRLEKTARAAVDNGFEAISGIRFLDFDFKKQNGYKKSIEHSKRHNLKRQKYCGCIYSSRERSQ